MESPCRKTLKRHESYTLSASNPCDLQVIDSDQILKILKDLYKEKKMCDVQLKVGDEVYGAHRLILSASSEVFQVMLMKSEWNQSSQNQIVLSEIPQCEKVFHSFLEYIYTGELLITHTNVQPILSLADKYKVKSLSKLCLQYMSDHLPHASSHNQLFSWLQYLQSCGHKEMATVCEDFIKLNFEIVSNTTDFINMDPETMIFFLKQDDLVVYNELMLYNCVVKWANLQKAKIEAENEPLINETGEKERNTVLIAEYIQYLTVSVMQYIRFPMIKPREIVDLLPTPLVNRNKEFFLDRMLTSMELHSVTEEYKTESWFNENKHLVQPRLYTIETYSASLIIDNFRSLPKFPKIFFEFHTNSSLFETDNSAEISRNTWVATLFPKGVLSNSQQLIATVSLKISCIDLYEPGKFKISILIYGVRRNVEHIMKVKSQIHVIREENVEIKIDDLVPFDMLNDERQNYDDSYLIGVHNNEFKVQIIITPVL